MNRLLQEARTIVVMGLGLTGLSVVNYLTRLALTANIQVIDTRVHPPQKDKLSNNVSLFEGGWHEHILQNADLIIINPGLSLESPAIQNAIKAGVCVIGDIELFAWAVNKPVIAITGSNGKSTVTDLTGELARACGIKARIGGNIGVPALDLLNEDAELYILELSSFQLETTSSLAPIAAAFLNLSEDHMDRHHDMDSYCLAKLNIFKKAKAGVVNQDEPLTYPRQISSEQMALPHKLTQVSVSHPSDFDIKIIKNKEWLCAKGQPFFAVDEVALVGRHNLFNILVACALLANANIDFKQGLDILTSYQGLAHRCQRIQSTDGITWINDSKATNVASTLAALKGLNCEGVLHLLVGGDAKKADVLPLQSAFKAFNLKLYCFGKDAALFTTIYPSAQRTETMAQAFALIKQKVKKGDTVILSPACASLDQFTNFIARGEAFIQLVENEQKRQ